MDGIFNIAGAIVTLAMVTVVVTSPNTAAVINSVTKGFANSIKAATASAQ